LPILSRNKEGLRQRLEIKPKTQPQSTPLAGVNIVVVKVAKLYETIGVISDRRGARLIATAVLYPVAYRDLEGVAQLATIDGSYP
jgi:hypothetical protein